VQLAGIQAVAMDVGALRRFVVHPSARPDSKIVFDRYHLMGYLTKAVDTTRKTENASFRHFWAYKRGGWGEKHLKRWYFWATHSRLQPIIEAAKAVKRHQAVGVVATSRRRSPACSTSTPRRRRRGSCR
jgi:transposase